VLRRAALEKEEPGLSVEAAIKILKNAEVPALILWTPQDAVGSAADHVAPLKTGLHAARDVEFKGAGHALPFTHAKEIAAPIQKFLDSLAGT
jgi:pimeloyl-ACP methyl ester carboxylesterase